MGQLRNSSAFIGTLLCKTHPESHLRHLNHLLQVSLKQVRLLKTTTLNSLKLLDQNQLLYIKLKSKGKNTILNSTEFLSKNLANRKIPISSLKTFLQYYGVSPSTYPCLRNFSHHPGLFPFLFLSFDVAKRP